MSKNVLKPVPLVVDEITLAEPQGYAPVPMMRAKAMSASADEALPVEAGKATLTASVNGTVQMTK